MSRYPRMSQRPAYDQTLLAGAPSITREDRQAGYDINALESGNYGAPIAAGNPQTGAVNGAREYEYPTAADPFADPHAQERPYTPSVTRSTKKPWWLTKRGRWALALGVIILIGLIAGIAAGTAAARNSQNRTLLGGVTTESPQGLDATSTSRTQALPSSSSSSSPLQPSASNPNPIVQQPSSSSVVTRTSLVASPTPATPTQGVPVQPPVGNSPGTTITFGAPPSPTAPGSSPDPADEIPLFCYVIPHSSACAPYFENYPPRR